MAGSPAFVAGILIIKFGDVLKVSASRMAAAIVPSVSWANRGDTSSETYPSSERRSPLDNERSEAS
jgi:hypothetical protein